MRAIKHKILVLSGKGGVGKSTVAANLSVALARLGSKVGVLDVDVCGPSIPKLMAVEGVQIVNSEFGWRPAISPFSGVKTVSVGALLPTDQTAIVWRGPRKTQIIKQFLKDVLWGKLDYLVFDTPPGTSDEHMTVVNCLRSSNPDGAIIVMTSQKFALDIIRKEISFCRKMGIPVLGIVENMSRYVCPCCKEVQNLFESSSAEALAAEYSVPILAQIPLEQGLMRCCESSQSIFEQTDCPESADAFLSLARRLVDSLGR
eukprot:m.116316 g.116316  ORF g.116316 m.116316 type:complete len:259 (-) comp51939_c0_seq1:12-788(-)